MVWSLLLRVGFFAAGRTIRPQRDHDHTDRDAHGNFGEPVERRHPDGFMGVRDEHDHGQGDTGETIRGPVQPQEVANQAQGEDAGGVGGQAGAEAGHQQRSGQRAQRGAGQPLPGNGQRRAQVGLHDDQGGDGRPVHFRQAQNPGGEQGQHRRNRGSGRVRQVFLQR